MEVRRSGNYSLRYALESAVLAGGFPGPDCGDERAEGKPAQILGGDKKEK